MKVVAAFMPVWDALTPPLGLAYLKASICAAGFECKAMDFTTELRPIMMSAVGDKAAETYVAEHPALYQLWAEQICAEEPDVVGFTILDSNIRNTELVAREIKKRSPQTTTTKFETFVDGVLKPAVLD